MDDETRTIRQVRTEEVVAAQPVVPVAAATPVYEAPVVARPAVADRVVTEHQVIHEGPSALELARRIVGLGFGILQGLIVLRLILLLLVANRDNDIVRAILGITDPFVNPFRDMFAIDRLAASGSVLDVAAIVALIGWTLVELLVFAVLNLGARRRTVAY
jgi:uncharacterized protein YggT (Ycf19 family)